MFGLIEAWELLQNYHSFFLNSEAEHYLLFSISDKWENKAIRPQNNKFRKQVCWCDWWCLHICITCCNLRLIVVVFFFFCEVMSGDIYSKQGGWGQGAQSCSLLSEKAATIFFMELSVKSILLVLMFILSNLTSL